MPFAMIDASSVASLALPFFFFLFLQGIARGLSKRNSVCGDWSRYVCTPIIFSIVKM